MAEPLTFLGCQIEVLDGGSDGDAEAEAGATADEGRTNSLTAT